ncbi:acyltransferase family protein [Neptunomonas sp.]|uniref:acyltransferase family protein n=1 Tax=Neptunomonas TaxID=75687 RepID=UPI003514C329
MPNQTFSLYLDVVRFLAAVLVLLYHSNWRELITDQVPLGGYGHSAVIIFFVLSGFVIAYVSDVKEADAKSYAVNRLSRIYSVAIPVLLMTPLLDVWGESISPVFYEDKTTHDLWYVRIFSSLLFLNEVWFVSIMSFSNVPYWSLCYEVWYYVIYAAYIFMRGWKRWVTIVSIALLLGPKILLLFPLWLVGVAIYKWQITYNLSVFKACVLWLMSFVAFYGFHEYGVQYALADLLKAWGGDYLYEQLTFSKYFLSDYLLVPIIAINFIAFRRLSGLCPHMPQAVSQCIRYVSGFTFILYLSHQPLLQFYGAVINGNPDSSRFYLTVIGLVIITVFALGFLTERRKRTWKRFFDLLLSWKGRARSLNT